MTTPYSVSLFAVADEGLWHTNPVWCVDRLLDAWEREDHSWIAIPELLTALLRGLSAKDIGLPLEALQRWQARGCVGAADSYGDMDDSPSPGVVGFVVNSQTAWVVPFQIEPSPAWSVDSNIPIRPPTVLQDLLGRTVLALGLPHSGAVPERFAYEVRERLGRRSDGPSMHIAALLAVVDRQNDRPALLRRSCAVVQPDGNRLVPVGAIDKKLKAFQREFTRGSLLVRPSECPAASAYDEYDAYFDEVWEVGSFQDLARRLEGVGLLDAFLSGSPLNAVDVGSAHECLRRLTYSDYQYREALSLAGRIQQCGYSAEVPVRTARKIRQTTTDLYRHLGCYEDAERLAQAGVREAMDSSGSSYDDQAHASVVHAASLYDPHRFAEMVHVLEPWLEKLTTDPLIVRPDTLVMVFNTLARGHIILSETDTWIALLRRSVDIQREQEPTDLPRTWNYLAHGLIRHGRLDEADSVLVETEHSSALLGISRWMCRFLRAEYHRARGQMWHSEEMEQAASAMGVGHPFGFYLQATARQLGCSQVDAVERFRLARDLFLQDAGPVEDANILHFLADCMRLGMAGWSNDSGLWSDARNALAEHLQPRPGSGLAEFYSEVWRTLENHPDQDAAEALLRRVPFF